MKSVITSKSPWWLKSWANTAILFWLIKLKARLSSQSSILVSHKIATALSCLAQLILHRQKQRLKILSLFQMKKLFELLQTEDLAPRNLQKTFPRLRTWYCRKPGCSAQQQQAETIPYFFLLDHVSQNMTDKSFAAVLFDKSDKQILTVFLNSWMFFIKIRLNANRINQQSSDLNSPCSNRIG